MHKKMISWGFCWLDCEYCVYARDDDTGSVLTAVHVDDFVSIASSKAANKFFKQQMKSVWTIAEGDTDFCLGIEIERDRPNRLVYVSQKAMIDRIVESFGQADAYPAATPMVENANSFLKHPQPDKQLSEEEKVYLAKLPYRSLIGQLLYPSLGSRPDIAFAVQKLSEFLDCYRRSHWEAAICVVRYLKGTRDLRLKLGGGGMLLKGFTDSSWGNCQDRCKSSMGYCSTIRSGMISWSARKQKVVQLLLQKQNILPLPNPAKKRSGSGRCFRFCHYRSQNMRTHPQILSRPHCTATTTELFALSLDPQFHSQTKHFDI